MRCGSWRCVGVRGQYSSCDIFFDILKFAGTSPSSVSHLGCHTNPGMTSNRRIGLVEMAKLGQL